MRVVKGKWGTSLDVSKNECMVMFLGVSGLWKVG